MKNSKPTGEVNGISLCVRKVVDTKSTDDYLAKRFTHWNVTGPSGYKPHVRELPPIYTKEELAELRPKAQVTDRKIYGFRKCATGIMDHYFPLLQGETVVEDLHTFTKEPYASHPQEPLSSYAGPTKRRSSLSIPVCRSSPPGQ